METSQKQTLEYLLMINKVENKLLHLSVKNSNSVSKLSTYIKQKKIKKHLRKIINKF